MANSIFVLFSIVALWILCIYMFMTRNCQTGYYSQQPQPNPLLPLPTPPPIVNAILSDITQPFTDTPSASYVYSTEGLTISPATTTPDFTSTTKPLYTQNESHAPFCVSGIDPNQTVCYDAMIRSKMLLTEDSLIPQLSSNVGKASYDIRGTPDVPLTTIPYTISSKPQI